MKRTLLVLTLLLCLLCSAAAASSEITVSATGSVAVAADTAVITLGANAREHDVQAAQGQVNAAIASVREALLAAGVPEADIHTDRVDIYTSYDTDGDGTRTVAYCASSTLAVRTMDMDRVGELIDLAFGAGANILEGVSFSASDTAEARAEALRAACADARVQADILAEASGLRIAGVVSVVSGGSYSAKRSTASFDTATEESAMAAPTVVTADLLDVTASVTVTYSAEAIR